MVTDVETKPESSEVLQSDILCGGTGRYLIADFMGEGAFGKVAKAVNFSASQIVALKILQTEQTAEREVVYLMLFENEVFHIPCLCFVYHINCSYHEMSPTGSFVIFLNFSADQNAGGSERS